MTTNKKSLLFAALLVVLAMFAASCGDDDDTSAGSDDGSADDGSSDDGTADDSTADDSGDDGTGDDGGDDGAAANPGEGVSVTMARANWSTGYMQAAIYHDLMEELGYDVSDPADLELPPSNFFTALGEGDVDFWANSWYPGHAAWWDNELTDGSIVGDHVSVVGEEMLAGGLQGFLTNKSIVDDNPGITLDAINDDPDLIALYDAGDSNPGNGIVEILGCPEDWTCDDIITETIEFAGWENIAQTKAGYDAMVAEAVGRAASGTPFIIYTWTPSGYVTQLIPGDNAMWLAVEEDSVLDGSITPEFSQLVDGVAVPAAIGLDACSADPCHLGWVAADIQVSARNDFLDANPAALALFEQVQISVIDVALQNVRYDGGENAEEDVRAHPAEWIATNRATVDEWLAAARAAA
ncbi:MAG: glycine betaine ABC transporter substrate-binding protein [Acidimicrobiales bacterium]|nr:MAG: glycine betaine ABC transporter substrate-binding protein [Acidimicrobiales bacterium]